MCHTLHVTTQFDTQLVISTMHLAYQQWRRDIMAQGTDLDSIPDSIDLTEPTPAMCWKLSDKLGSPLRVFVTLALNDDPALASDWLVVTSREKHVTAFLHPHKEVSCHQYQFDTFDLAMDEVYKLSTITDFDATRYRRYYVYRDDDPPGRTPGRFDGEAKYQARGLFGR